MRIILVAAGMAALIGAAPASAATVKGTVVAKDAKRGTVVTAGRGGEVTTLRVKRAGSFTPGQRVRAKAVKRADGTYDAPRVKKHGRARAAKLRATLVARQGRAYLVSAGSSTFAVPAARRGAASAAAAAPQPGDVVSAELRLAKGRVAAKHVEQVGEAGLLELEGIFLDAADGELRLAVAKQGLVKVAVPAGMTIAPEAGDEVELLVSVGDAGFTLVAIEGDDGEGGFEIEEGEAEVEGVITAIGAGSITVGAITCAVPEGLDLSGFAVGDWAEMRCEEVDGVLQVRELETDEAELDDEGEHENEYEDD